MTYTQALDYIHSLRRFGKKAGLTKITRLLALLGDPQKKLKFVHVAGTNGKGSTVAMTASVLQAAGYKTGLFISPFVVDFTERMQINGAYIPQQDLARVTERVQKQVEIVSAEMECPSEFEVVTAIGLCWFNEQGCDIVCLEVGLGGRFDPTNVIDRPLVAVICNIGLDHTDILGDTIEKIAFEKCGIIKEGGTVVCYPDLAPEALAVVMQAVAERGGRLTVGNQNAAVVVQDEVFQSVVRYGGLTLTLPLGGRHQVLNLITVLCTVEELKKQGFVVPDEAIIQGISAVRFPARMETLRLNPRIVLDGGHNPQGLKTVAETAARVSGTRVLILGSLGDKDYREGARILTPVFDRVFTVTVHSARGIGAQALCGTVRDYNPSCTPCEDLKQALALAVQAAGEDGCVFVCGSLFLAAEIRPILLEMPQ